MEIGGFLKICGIGLCTAVAAVILSEVGRAMRLPVKLTGSVMLYGGVLALLLPILSELSGLAAGYGVSEYGGLMMKSLGVALLAEISAGLCRDMGEASLGVLIELGGKAVILLMIFPVIRSLLETAAGLLP